MAGRTILSLLKLVSYSVKYSTSDFAHIHQHAMKGTHKK